MRPMRGFTLLELIVVLAIAGALAIVAMSAWPAYSARARRTAAGAALVSTLAQMELRHAQTGSYETRDMSPESPVPGVDGYTIVGNQPCTPASRQCAMVIAIAHHADPPCGTLTLNSTGERTPDDPACWP